MEKILVIDIGTTRLKVACVDENGTIENILSETLPKTSATEQEPNLWIDRTLKLISQLVQQRKKGVFSSIVLTGNMHSLLAIDKNGEPLFNAWLWNDLRAVKECEYLNSHYGEEIKSRFFNPIIPGFPLPKLLYLKKNDPEIFDSIWKILQPKDFIAFKLCGNVFTDFTDASGTLIFNLKNKSWDEEFLMELGFSPSILPEVVASYQKIGNLKDDVARSTGLKVGIPVIIGAGDLATASLGSKVNEDSLVLVLGTAGQVLTLDTNLINELEGKIFAFSYVDPEYYLYLGTIPAGGYSFEWFSKVWSMKIEEIFEQAKHSRKNLKLLYFPFIQGSGTPHMKYEPFGAFLNISDEDSTPEFCKALIEGVIFALKESSDTIEKFTKKKDILILQSLAAKVPLIQDIIFSLYNSKEIYLSNQKEASVIGAAILGAVGSGIYSSISQAQENMVSISNLDISNKGGEIEVLERFKEYERLSKILTKAPLINSNDIK